MKLTDKQKEDIKIAVNYYLLYTAGYDILNTATNEPIHYTEEFTLNEITRIVEDFNE